MNRIQSVLPGLILGAALMLFGPTAALAQRGRGVGRLRAVVARDQQRLVGRRRDIGDARLQPAARQPQRAGQVAALP